jgi:hypothetical protein
MVFGKVSVSFAREVKVGLNFIAEKLATELRLGVLFFIFRLESIYCCLLLSHTRTDFKPNLKRKVSFISFSRFFIFF